MVRRSIAGLSASAKGLASRRGFTLIEATVALAITTICGASLLLALESSIESADAALERLQAEGMADQLMHEIASKRYMVAGGSPYQSPGAPNSWEKQGVGRERYDDIDDFDAFSASPPKDAWGQTLGQDTGLNATRHVNFRVAGSPFAQWRQRVDMYYVSEANTSLRLANGATSNFRCLHVQIYYNESGRSSRLLAERKRVFAYVPEP